MTRIRKGFNLNFVKIETNRLVLRPYKLTDFEQVHTYGSDPDFSKYEDWGPNTPDITKEYIEKMIAEANSTERFHFNFAVALKENDLLIGGCGIRRETENSSVANLGWAITTNQQNKGYATESAKALIEFGFKTLQLKVIYATCDTRNSASFKVMEKLGMKRVGMIKSHKMVKNYMRDTYRYEISLL